MWHSRPPRDPHPPFMANTILNFHFDYLHPSLSLKKGFFLYNMLKGGVFYKIGWKEEFFLKKNLKGGVFYWNESSSINDFIYVPLLKVFWEKIV